jgi:hypothetical protein
MAALLFLACMAVMASLVGPLYLLLTRHAPKGDEQ